MKARRKIVRDLITAAKLIADVGDVEVVEPIGEKPVKTRRNKRMKKESSMRK